MSLYINTLASKWSLDIYFVMISVQLEGLLHVQSRKLLHPIFFYHQNVINFVAQVPK